MMAHPALRVLPDVVQPCEIAHLERPDENIDRFGRRIDYLRVSITDRCNLRCIYCMPAEGIALSPKDELLSFEETWRICAAARRIGFKKFRLTGGEPLIVRDVMTFVDGMARSIDGAQFCLTTNGLRFRSYARDLLRAGISHVNFSLDTVDPAQFRALTRRDGVQEVIAAIDEALALGFEKVKLNAVIVVGRNEDAIIPMVELLRERPIELRFIEQMPLDGRDDHGFLGAQAIIQRIGETFSLVPATVADPRDSAPKLFTSQALAGRVGVIAPRSQKFCASCNRMRLTPSGELKGCLLSEGTLDIRKSLRQGISEADLESLLLYAIGIKPYEYNDNRYGLDRTMSAIGG